MKHRIRVIMIATVVVVAVGSVLLYNYLTTETIAENTTTKVAPKGGAKTTPVDIHIADRIQLEEGIRSVGTLIANEEVNITSEIAGKVERITFDEGVIVKKGALMITINDDDLQSQLKRALFQRNLLKDKLERSRILLDKDAISREAFDQIETDYNMIQADIQLLEVKIDKTEIKAPFTGVVGFRSISLGSYIQPNTLIAKIIDCSKLKIEFPIPEKHLSDKLKGMSITFSTVNSTKINNAKIYAIDPTIDVKTRAITLRALYNNSDLRLLPGMSAKVSLGGKTGQTIAIPTQAIISEAEGKKVWIVSGGKAKSVKVTTAIRTDTMIEVIKGLAVGDSVIITGLLQVKEGAPVQINN